MPKRPTKAPDEMDVALGATVRLRRRAMGLSQEMLAEACGVTFQQVQKYENGTNRISFSRLVQLARALDCRVADLIGALDAEAAAPGPDLDLLARLGTPGAADLLDAYEKLPPHSRIALLGLLRNACVDAGKGASKAA